MIGTMARWLVLGVVPLSLVCVPAPPARAQGAPGTRILLERDGVLARVRAANDGLARLRARAIEGLASDADIVALQRLLSELEQVVVTAPIVATVPAGPAAAPAPPAPSPPAAAAPPPPSPLPPAQSRTLPPPIGDTELKELAVEIKAQRSGEERLSLLQRATVSQAYTTAQAEALLPLFKLASDKLIALQLLAPRLVDRAQAPRLLKAFSGEELVEARRAIE